MMRVREKSSFPRPFGAAGLILVLGFLCLSGCGEPECVSSTGELGTCCDAEEHLCAEGLECFDEFPAGLCSRACDDENPCPSGAYCITIQSQSQGNLGQLCLELCEEGSPCREAYACRETSLPGVRVCFPD